MQTFKDLFDFIQNNTSDNLQIYSNKRQVNVLNEDGLSIMNLVFADEEVHMYHCDRPGYAKYDQFLTYQYDEDITILPNRRAVNILVESICTGRCA